jgi:hypothetical protein
MAFRADYSAKVRLLGELILEKLLKIEIFIFVRGLRFWDAWFREGGAFCESPMKLSKARIIVLSKVIQRHDRRCTQPRSSLG